MTENYSIKDLLKASNVKRWHTVPTVWTQSVAEHQWNVSMISECLALKMGLNDEHLFSLIRIALLHDIEEIWTGDMPSPHKELMAKRVSTGDTHNAPRGRYTGSSLTCEDGPPVASGDTSNGGSMVAIVRAADLIDAWQWSKKFVLDPDVVEDCEGRLSTFMLQLMGDSLCLAMIQVMDELE